jgi:hypothetical protein
MIQIGDILIYHNPIPNDHIERISNVDVKTIQNIKWCVININKEYYTILNLENKKTLLFNPEIIQKHFIKKSEWRNYQINKILN